MLRLVKEKGRIYLKNSVVLLGTADYLSRLGPNEIFLQIPASKDFSYKFDEVNDKNGDN